MRTYYDHGGITLYHADCREILPSLGPVDAILTDPPYLGARGQSWEQDRVPLVVDYTPASEALLDTLVRESVRILRNGWFGAFQDFPGMVYLRRVLESQDVMLAFAPAVWCKPAGAYTPNGTANSIAKSVDFITVARVGSACEKQRPGHYVSPSYSPMVEIFRTGGKPLSLMADLVRDYTAPDSLVLDPFMGAGTTLLACKNLGRRAIGIEVDERCCEIAATRLAQDVLPFEQTA